jgi:hypothetical protein
MLTFFTTAKAFEGHSAIIQRNALQSWKCLHPDVEVILFGDDPGAADVCAELGLRHEPHVERHESGMKYLSYMFRKAQEIARHNLLCYSNCDIVFMQDFRFAVDRAAAWSNRFLLIGRRWDLDVAQPIPFDSPQWGEELRSLALRSGRRQIPDFLDFFVFTPRLFPEIPPLVVGRSYWDNWLVWAALASKAVVVDASGVVTAVHQNHGYGYHPAGKTGTNTDAVALRNYQLAGGLSHLRTSQAATHLLTPRAIAKNRLAWLSQPRRYCRNFFLVSQTALQSYLWHPLLDLTRPLRHPLGLRQKKTSPRVRREEDPGITKRITPR